MPDATVNLAVLVAQTGFATASNELLIAEETARTAELEPAIAATYSAGATAEVAVGVPRDVAVGLEVFASGSAFLTTGMRVVVSAASTLGGTLSLAVAEPYSVATAVDVLTTDAVSFLIEPDRPRAAPIVELTDLALAPHPNAITSPTTDFETLGVQPGDVLELTGGLNVGNYLVAQVQGNALFVSEAFPYWYEAPPLAGEIRVRDRIFATQTAALVLDQALFVGGLRVSLNLDLVVS